MTDATIPKVDLGTLSLKIDADTKDLVSMQKQLQTHVKYVKRLKNEHKKYQTIAKGAHNISARASKVAQMEVSILKDRIEAATNSMKKLGITQDQIRIASRRSFKEFIDDSYLYSINMVRNASLFVRKMGALRLFGVGASVVGIVKTIDDFKRLRNQVDLFTESTAQSKSVMNKLGETARKTGTSVKANVKLFTNMARAAKQYSISMEELLQITENVTKLGVISGASQSDMESTILQLSHAISGGKLNAMELNSIMQHIPELAEALAKGLAGGTAELRKMVHEGRFLTGDIFEKLLMVTAEVDKKFAKVGSSVQTDFKAMTTAFAELFAVAQPLGKALSFIIKTMTILPVGLKKATDAFQSEFPKVITLEESLDNAIKKLKILKDKLGSALPYSKAEDKAFRNFVAQQKAVNNLWARKHNKDADLREAERQKKRLADAAKTAEIQKHQMQWASGLLGLEITKEIYEMELQEQATFMRRQIDKAARHSREMFLIQKGLLIAAATYEGIKGVTSSYTTGTEAGGQVLGVLYGGLALGSGLANIMGAYSLGFGGAMASGGNVKAGSFYEVNERGTEILSQGGKDYLIMGGHGGKVTPAGGNKVTINIHEAPSTHANVVQNGNSIEILIENIENRIASGIGNGSSTIADVMQRQYGLNRAGGLT